MIIILGVGMVVVGTKLLKLRKTNPQRVHCREKIVTDLRLRVKSLNIIHHILTLKKA